MKKILILGDANSIWVKKYIENVLSSEVYRVYLPVTGKTKFDDFYKQMKVELVSIQCRFVFFDQIPKVSGLASIIASRNALKKYGPYDIIHVHYVRRAMLLLASLLKSFGTRIIVSYWGSDLLRKDECELKKESKYFSNISCFTLSSDVMYERFMKTYGLEYVDRINKVRFGVSGYAEIMHIQDTMTRESCKEFLGANPEKILIAVGYNKASGQQHDKVLSQIQTLDKALQERIEIVLQCTYGECGGEYWQSLLDIIERLYCKTIVITDYMGDADIAKLRFATDIYINAQISDAFSATMQEYLFSGAVVLNPTWLNYPEITEFKLSCIEYTNMSDIREILSDILQKGVHHQMNNRVIYQHTSWENVKELWEKCYFFPVRK